MTEIDRLNQYKEYEDLDNDDYTFEMTEILNKWESFLKKNDPNLITNGNYFVHSRNLFEVIRRVDKRKVYYKVFHKLNAINEYKRTALTCYWIITLKPFFVSNENSPIYNAPNELFAFFLILATIRSAYDEILKEDKEFAEKHGDCFSYPCDERISDIIYNFKYTDVSREAMISFVETFADNWGVGITYILQKQKEKTSN